MVLHFRTSRNMNFVVFLCGVTFVVLNTVVFTSASCQDSGEEDSLHPIVVYDITFLTDEQRIPVDSFVTTFAGFVQESEILQDVFDISDTPSIQFTQFAYQFIFNILKDTGSSNPDIFADIATRPMGQNYKTFSRQAVITVYANLAAIYLYSEGVLTQDNVNDLAVTYATIMEINASENVVQGNATTKFYAIKNGFVEFVSSYGILTAEKAVKLCYFYEGLWLETAVETRSSNDLYMQCVLDAEEDSNESNSGSDSSSSESDSSSSESDSSSPESDSSSSESDSGSSGSSSSSSASGSSSYGSDESQSG